MVSKLNDWMYEMSKKLFARDSASNGVRKYSVCFVFSFLLFVGFFGQIFFPKDVRVLSDVVFAGTLATIIGGFYAANAISKVKTMVGYDATSTPVNGTSDPPPPNA